MDPDKNASKPDESEAPKAGDQQQAPAGALSMTPDELDKEEAAQAVATPATTEPAEKKVSPVKRFFRKVNLYFLIFILVVIVVGIITVVNYLNSTKPPVEPNIATQELDEDALKQLDNTDATVGGAAQTLTIQGNAIIVGQTLMRGNLNVAGNLQTGGSIQGPSLTISGESNLGQTQIDDLQVAQDLDVEGDTNLQTLSVAGASSFSGAMVASQISVTNLILSGNASLRVPNHISFTGSSPSRVANNSVLGNSGSASVDGSDTSGTININSGNNPNAGCFVRINFAQAFSNNPHVIISPVGATAGQIQYYVDRDRNGFSICSNNAPASNRVFAFDYFVTN